ncbi:tail fiber protein containing depolymerase domain [Proteus phage BigMira-UFV01]|nr:tail fiber protein containing depolymerase domain [Proteus phage BigMira-UFV01]
MANTRATSSQVIHDGVILHDYLFYQKQQYDKIKEIYPWQFGAIGDGIFHPLSERFSTLQEAQKVYPHVTSLNQSIDWAACQAAENYARGVGVVRCTRYYVFHFGDSDYLELGENSKWIGIRGVHRDASSVVMIRTVPINKPSFGEDCVVRVMDAEKAGSRDEFVRGIVFDGFVLSRGVERLSPNKGKGTICFHANYGIGMELGIVAFGAEFGVFGYSFWGSTGWLKIDSCHKGFFADASIKTPEHPISPVGSVNTTFCFDVRIDCCVFGIVLKRVKYSKFYGYIEGMRIDERFKIYDKDNETAIAVTAISCDSVDITQLGIEAWSGCFVYNNSSTVTINLSWTQDELLTNTTGKQSAYYTISQMMGVRDEYSLPSSNNSYFYVLNKGLLTLRNMTGDMSNQETHFSTTYLVHIEANSRFLMENTGIYFGSSRRITPNNWSCIECINDPFMPIYLVPAGYTYIGRGLSIKTEWERKAISGGDGGAQIDAPDGYKIVDITILPECTSKEDIINFSISNITDTRVNVFFNVNESGKFFKYKFKLKRIN